MDVVVLDDALSFAITKKEGQNFREYGYARVTHGLSLNYYVTRHRTQCFIYHTNRLDYSRYPMVIYFFRRSIPFLSNKLTSDSKFPHGKTSENVFSKKSVMDLFLTLRTYKQTNKQFMLLRLFSTRKRTNIFYYFSKI